MESINSPQELHGFIHFVSSDSVCEDMLLTNYYDFRKKHPKIHLKFTNADTPVMFDMLDNNEADAIITLDNHIYQKNYIIEKEEPVDMYFVANVNSPFANKKFVKEEEFGEN